MEAKTSRICEGAGQGPGRANGALIKALSEGDSFDIASKSAPLRRYACRCSGCLGVRSRMMKSRGCRPPSAFYMARWLVSTWYGCMFSCEDSLSSSTTT